MNFLRKGWCRAYQLVFRLALPFLPYRTPQLLHRVQDVPGALKQEGISRILLVTDARIRGAGWTASLEQALSESGILCTVYDDTVANPTVDNVEAARQRYLQQQCQGLIAFGGGSSIDCAKAVGARLAQPKKTLGEMNGILKIHRRLPVLVAIPTTAGTGSETTLAAVITDPATHHKYPINDFPLIPRYAVLDPEVTRSLPPFVTATTGMDALTHAIEAYIGGSTTCETRAAATKAVQLIFTYLKRAVENGSEMEAREQMLQDAFLAGSAFSKLCAAAHRTGSIWSQRREKAAPAQLRRRSFYSGGIRRHWRSRPDPGDPPDEPGNGHSHPVGGHSRRGHSPAGALCRPGGKSPLSRSPAVGPHRAGILLLCSDGRSTSE